MTEFSFLGEPFKPCDNYIDNWNDLALIIQGKCFFLPYQYLSDCMGKRRWSQEANECSLFPYSPRNPRYTELCGQTTGGGKKTQNIKSV